MRLHPYLTERMLQQSPALAPLGRIAVQHRERLDGSGYRAGSRAPRSRGPRGSSPPPTPTRRCASPARTGRALSADDAAAQLRADVRAGRLDAEAVEAVLARPATGYGAAAKAPPG